MSAANFPSCPNLSENRRKPSVTSAHDRLLSAHRPRRRGAGQEHRGGAPGAIRTGAQRARRATALEPAGALRGADHKERLALEEAIRKVEAEATRKSHNESQAKQQANSRAATSRPPTPEAVPQVRRASEAPRWDRNNPPPTDMPRPGWTVPSARERLLSSRSSLRKRGVKDFGDVVGEVGAASAKATQTARQNSRSL